MQNRLVESPAALAALVKGRVGVLPTDTIYGLVARAADRQAVGRLYSLKHRDHKPGTVIAANIEQLAALGVPAAYLARVKHWWPNPISIEIPLGDDLAYLHQNTGRQAFRVVRDPGLRSLLTKTGPLLTTSANPPGKPTAADLSNAQDYFGDRVDFYVDGGDLSDRAPSTIIRVTDHGVEVIRQGAVTVT